MTDSIKLAGKLPPTNELNGLAEAAESFVKDEDDLHVAIVVLGTKQITRDVETGETTPTAVIRRIEPITDLEDRERLGHIATRAFERRTGKAVLPLDIEDELRDIFSGSRTTDSDGEDEPDLGWPTDQP